MVYDRPPIMYANCYNRDEQNSQALCRISTRRRNTQRDVLAGLTIDFVMLKAAADRKEHCQPHYQAKPGHARSL